MHSGWVFNFKVNREISGLERKENLSSNKRQSFEPASGSLIKFNSSYIEFLDRRFKDKGEIVISLMVCILLFFIYIIFYFSIDFIANYDDYTLVESLLFFLVVVLLGGGGCFLGILIKGDLFTYTYCPVRFNRKTQKIYFFQKGGSNNVVTLPWGDKRVFFHIGHGHEKNIRDLRCHWMPDGPGGLIKQTFVVGSYSDHENYVREEWELIRRYMQDGPEHCFDNEYDRVIDASPCTSWRCCYEHSLLFFGSVIHLRHVLFPLILLMTLSRWLTFKTCRKPVWPAEIEAECVIDPNDPYRLPEPDPRTGEHPLIEQNPGYLDRTLMRLKQRDAWYPESQARFAHLSSELKARAERAERASKENKDK